MLVVMALPMMVACGDDDGGSGGSIKSKLVGIWKTSINSSNWKCIEIKSDGTIRRDIFIQDDGTIHACSNYNSKIKTLWTYDEKEQVISMFTDDGYYTYTYKVNMADDGNSWAGYTTSSSGSTKTVSFVRLQGPIIEAEN